jgi:hypothetical protein
MVDEPRHEEEIPEHANIRFEPTDANFGWIMAILIAGVVLAAILLLALTFFYASYKSYQANIKRSPFPLAPGPSWQLPPEPRLEQLNHLEGRDAGNVFASRLAKERELHRYGSTDDKAYVHIPVEKAMELILSKLPARPEVAGGKVRDQGLVDAGEPNSGRLFRTRPR